MSARFLTAGAATAALFASLLVGLPAAAQEVRSSNMPFLGIERSHDAPFRQDEIEIVLPAKGQEGAQVEYKLAMKPGDIAVYSVTSPEPVILEFHGHSASGQGVIFYREQADATAAHGQFVAPLEGIHGWFINNPHDHPVTVTIRTAGYYEVTPLLRF